MGNCTTSGETLLGSTNAGSHGGTRPLCGARRCACSAERSGDDGDAPVVLDFDDPPPGVAGISGDSNADVSGDELGFGGVTDMVSLTSIGKSFAKNIVFQGSASQVIKSAARFNSNPGMCQSVSKTSRYRSQRSGMDVQRSGRKDASSPSAIMGVQLSRPKDGAKEPPAEPEVQAVMTAVVEEPLEVRSPKPGDKDYSFFAELKGTVSHALKIVIENPHQIDQVYKVESVILGKGAFGSVKKATVRATRAVRAVKFVSKARMKGHERMMQTEIAILKSVDHPNVIKLYELFEDSELIYMVMELCSGGALLDHQKHYGPLSEKETAQFMVQILRGMNYLHTHDICHRDMKPANCLIVKRQDSVARSTLRISDFGLSCTATEKQIMKARNGTLAFMAPQVISRKYDRTCDTWSCGVTMFVLMSGKVPFPGQTDDQIRAKVTAGLLEFGDLAWVDTSQACISFIQGLMTVNPKARTKLKDALQSPWLRAKAREHLPEPALDFSVLENLKGFRSLNKFKRAALCIIASMLDEEQTREARDLFAFFDTNEDGKLDEEELRIKFQTDNGDVMELNLSAGCKDESYTYTEFLAATFDRDEYCQREVCLAAFHAFDTDGSGSIDCEELIEGWVLGELSDDEVDRLVQEFDADGDGKIDFEEFMSMMRDGEGWTPRSRRRLGGSSPRSSQATPRGKERGQSRVSGSSTASTAASCESQERAGVAGVPGTANSTPRQSPLPRSPRAPARRTSTEASTGKVEGGAASATASPRLEKKQDKKK